MREQQGERLKLIRKHLGLRQKTLADKLGVTPSALSEIENGRNKISNEIGAKLIDLYNVNLNWILTGQGEMISRVDKVEEPSLPYKKENIRSELEALREHYIDFVSKLKDKSREEILEEMEALAKKKGKE